MQDLTNCKYLQKSIINYESQEESKKSIRLMKTIDSLNKKFNNEVITWAIAKKPKEWEANRNSLSFGSTTDIRKIPNIMRWKGKNGIHIIFKQTRQSNYRVNK